MRTTTLHHLIVFLGFCAFMCAACDRDPIELVRNGESEYSIVIPSDPEASEVRAAELFQKYVEAISGCRLAIRDTAPANSKAVFIREKGQKKYDGYTVTTREGSVFIDGSQDSRGCVYGVVSLLESYMGVHLYSPEYRVIPKSKEIVLPVIKLSDASVNRKRSINFFTNEYAKDEDLLDFNRIETGFRGIARHSYNHLVPSGKYYESHPEYYAFRDGKRVTSQLCLSNPEVLEIAIATLKDDIAANPDLQSLDVAQNDDIQYCRCDDCMRVLEEEKSPSGSVIRFANAIAEEFPDKMILTYAYQYSRRAPALVKPLPNVMVTLCSIELNRSRPIAEDTMKTSRDFVEDITNWGSITENIVLWDYTINFHNFLCPFPNFHVMQPNILFFTQNNVFNHFQQSDIWQGLEFGDLRLYLISRLLWNPDIDVGATIDEYLEGYYGAAAPWIRKYMDQMQAELLKSGKPLNIFEPMLDHQEGYLSERNMADYNRYFDEAEEAVRGNETFLRHVELARLPLNLAMLEIGKYNLFSSRGWFDASGTERNKKMDDILEEFHTVCRREKITRMNEEAFSSEKYYHFVKHATNADNIVKGNHALHKKVKASVEPLDFYRGTSHLTDGVLGEDFDWEYLWVGWNGTDVDLVVDLEKDVRITSVELNTFKKTAWGRILHPRSVECMVSRSEHEGYVSIGKTGIEGDQREESTVHRFSFTNNESAARYRYVKLKVEGTLVMPDVYRLYAGQPSMVLIDEIIIR